MNKRLSVSSLCLLATLSLPSWAQWQLDNQQSRLNFVSVKKTSIAENHYFNQFSGTLTKQGQLQVAIDLASVDTKIAIRDQRMKQFVFETSKFSQAQFSAQLDMPSIQQLAVGDVNTMSVAGMLNFHGVKQAVTAEVLVAKLASNKMLISTTQPIFIKAEEFQLGAAIEKLKALASLANIDSVVPVSFNVVFTKP